MNDERKTNWGYTLIEVLVALFISMLILMLSTAILTNFNKRIQKVEKELNALQIAVNKMEEYIYNLKVDSNYQLPQSEHLKNFTIEYRTNVKRDILEVNIIMVDKNSKERITNLRRFFYLGK